MPATKSARKTSAVSRVTRKGTKRLARQIKTLKRDPARIQIFLLVADGKKHPSQIYERLGPTEPDHFYHLAWLRHAGLIGPRRKGKHRFYELTKLGKAIVTWIRKSLNQADPSPGPVLTESAALVAQGES
jgi:predicted transcriptional regulator